jgi:hypothetical protein
LPTARTARWSSAWWTDGDTVHVMVSLGVDEYAYRRHFRGGTTEFGLTGERAMELYESGRIAAREFLAHIPEEIPHP